MIRYRFKTEEEMESEYNNLSHEARGNVESWIEWFSWDDDEEHRFVAGKIIPKETYDDITGSWGKDYIEDLDIYDKWEAEFGRSFEFYVEECQVIKERYGEMKSHKGVLIGDVLLHDGVACEILRIYKENVGVEFEFEYKGNIKYKKSRIAKIVKKRILNKVK